MLWIQTLTPFQGSEIHEKIPNRTKAFKIFKQIMSAFSFLHGSLKCQSGFYACRNTLHPQQCPQLDTTAPIQQALSHTALLSWSFYMYYTLILPVVHPKK